MPTQIEPWKYRLLAIARSVLGSSIRRVTNSHGLLRQNRTRARLVAGILYAILLPALVSSCGRPTRTVAGFPNFALKGYSKTERNEISQTMEDRIRDIRKEIRSTEASDPLYAKACNALYDSLLPLSNDHADYLCLSSEYEHYVLKQVLPPTDRPPLQLYPRITHAHLAEATPLRATSAGAGTGDGDRRYWFVPLLLSKRAISCSPPTRVQSWFQRTGERLGLSTTASLTDRKQLLHELSFWLEPKDESSGSACVWHKLDDPIHDDFVLPGTRYNLFHPDSSIMGLTFTVAVDAESGESEKTVEPGYYNIRVLPRLRCPMGSSYQTAFGRRLECGDWRGARDAIGDELVTRPGALFADLSMIRDSIKRLRRPTRARPAVRWFDRPLHEFQKRCVHLHRDIRLYPARTGWLSVAHVQAAIDGILDDRCPAPVLLDDSGECEAFSFIVAADLQYHEDNREIHEFLDCVSADGHRSRTFRQLDTSLQNKVRDAKFVLLVGDLADGAAGSASKVLAGGRLLGILPPTSPYTNLGEFADLVKHLDRLGKPVFAVPGNHDGMVGYGGVISFYLDSLAEFLNEFPVIRNVLARPVFTGNEFIPNGPKFHVPTTAGMVPRQSALGQAITPRQGDGFCSWFFAPRYDGLVEWRWHLGPLNVAFEYRGCTFVGLNSYGLAQPDRAGVGLAVFNWGGGVTARDIGWLDAMLNVFAEDTEADAPGYQFLFMHQDPRGFTPSKYICHQTTEARDPAYDPVDSWGSFVTLGYAGLGYSPAWGLFLPVITPAVAYGIDWCRYPGRFQQEWMQGYGAEGLIDVISKAATRPTGSWLSHIFFGHNDVKQDGYWFDEHGQIFPPDRHEEDGLATLLVKTRRVGRPPWVNEEDQRLGDRKTRVFRLDDVGNVHESEARWKADRKRGFHVVTVDPNEDEPNVEYVEMMVR